MSFPNTSYKPGDEVWYLRPLVHSAPAKDRIYAVQWTEEEITYELAGITGTWDGDDLYPTEEAAQRAANETGSQ